MVLPKRGYTFHSTQKDIAQKTFHTSMESRMSTISESGESLLSQSLLVCKADSSSPEKLP